jgi:hypothetical protein
MLLPTRKRQKKKPSALPKEFLRSVSELFGKQFKSKLSGATFLVYGDLYGDEAVLCVSLSHPKSLRAASLHLSSELPKDISENPEKVTERLKTMVDVAASWFNQCFEAGSGLESVLAEMGDAEPLWQEFDWEGCQLFVKLNRDNYTLENAASSFLKKAGFSDEGDDVLDEIDEDEELPS